ncbi:MAG: hypothetical protein IKU10_01115 [Clostridia bacterium]|nr:hypothetical protein [Clostridia bacterium]
MLVIGLDIGTTGTKALVVDETGTIYGHGYQEYGLITAPGGQVTQSAKDWQDATVHAIQTAVSSVDASEIVAIGISTQGASMAVCERVEDAGLVYTWMDGRAVEQVKTLGETVGYDAFYKKTGWSLFAGGDAAKLLWLKENGLFGGTEKLVSTLSYINHFLTGQFVSDPTNSAIRQFYNIQTQAYDTEILNYLGITEENLPKVQPTGSLVGGVLPAIAQRLGIPAGTPVFNGAHDQYCAAIGCGVTNVGDMMLATGTTWVVLGVTNKPIYTRSGICPGVHPAGNYGAMASQVNAGSALKWFKEQIGDSYKEIDRVAATRAENCQDLFWIPYLAGAGFPSADPQKRATIHGLSLHHDKYDMARALMEGVAFEARRSLMEYQKAGMPTGRLMMAGGAAKSDFWVNVVAATLPEWELYISECADAAPVGAAIFALKGAGAIASLSDAPNLTCCRKVSPPSSGEVAYYKEKFAKYLALL